VKAKELKHKSLKELVEIARGDGNLSLRQAAVAGLGLKMDADAIPPLIEFLDEPRLKVAATIALLKLGAFDKALADLQTANASYRKHVGIAMKSLDGAVLKGILTADEPVSLAEFGVQIL
jgi:HEAT repeat protein